MQDHTHWRFSLRHIDNLLAKGMPHLKIGSRRVRIIIAEADKWMSEQYGTQRRRAATTKSFDTPGTGSAK
jgi:hypothetical protein